MDDRARLNAYTALPSKTKDALDATCSVLRWIITATISPLRFNPEMAGAGELVALRPLACPRTSGPATSSLVRHAFGLAPNAS